MREPDTFVKDFMNDLESGKFDNKGLFEPIQEGELLTEEFVERKLEDFNKLLDMPISDFIMNENHESVKQKRKVNY